MTLFLIQSNFWLIRLRTAILFNMLFSKFMRVSFSLGEERLEINNVWEQSDEENIYT
jgi:hypothetical protein